MEWRVTIELNSADGMKQTHEVARGGGTDPHSPLDPLGLTLDDGKTLLAFWRDVPPATGINFQRVFTEPRDFDAVLWAQGSEAAPYLEEGDVTPGEFWNDLWRSLDGEFLGFAVWFN